MKVELIYEKTCPNIEAARAQLIMAFSEACIAPHWQEWEVSAADAPDYVHGYGSPTILVNGKDVSGDMANGDDYCCRIYSHDEHTNKGIPALADIVSALKSAQPFVHVKNHSGYMRLNSAMLPSVGVTLLPKLACPACWPAYTGLLSSLGIGFIDYTPYLLPLTVVFLIIAIFTLAYRASQRQGYRPLLMGVFSVAIILFSKFYYGNDAGMYAGLALLVGASLWNTWPRPQVAHAAACLACVTLDHAKVK